MLGDGFWMVGRVCGGLERKFAVGWIFWQKKEASVYGGGFDAAVGMKAKLRWLRKVMLQWIRGGSLG